MRNVGFGFKPGNFTLTQNFSFRFRFRSPLICFLSFVRKSVVFVIKSFSFCENNETRISSRFVYSCTINTYWIISKITSWRSRNFSCIASRNSYVWRTGVGISTSEKKITRKISCLNVRRE